MDLDIQQLIDAAQGAGRVVMEYFGKAAAVTEKTNSKDIVTEADRAAEQYITGKLAGLSPRLNVYAEESGQVDNGSDYTVVIDPLDGTSNFVSGIPNFAVSIGVMDEQGRAVLGVVYHPVLNRTYSAAAGKGAFLNGQPIHVNDVTETQQATISFGCGYASPAEYRLQFLQKASNLPIKRVLENWSPAYEFCLLASGKIEAIVSNGLDLEDYVAGKLILREAGGKITDFTGQPLTDDRANVFVASNGTGLHDQLLQIV